MARPTRCIDPVMKYCQGCRYGNVFFSSDEVETTADLEGASFTTSCSYHLEDTEPTEEEIKEFEEWANKVVE